MNMISVCHLGTIFCRIWGFGLYFISVLNNVLMAEIQV